MAHILPAKDSVLGKHMGITDGVLSIILHMLIDVIADEQVHKLALVHPLPDGMEHLLQVIGFYPVIRVHHLIIYAGGVTDALIDALAMASVRLMDHPNDVRMLCGIAVSNGRRFVGRTVVYQNDLYLVSAGE